MTASGSSWIQVTSFTHSGPESRGILTYSLSTNPESPHFADQTKLFSRKRWLKLPFHEREVERSAITRVRLREGGADCGHGRWRDFAMDGFSSERACIAHHDELRTQRLQEIRSRH